MRKIIIRGKRMRRKLLAALLAATLMITGILPVGADGEGMILSDDEPAFFLEDTEEEAWFEDDADEPYEAYAAEEEYAGEESREDGLLVGENASEDAFPAEEDASEDAFPAEEDASEDAFPAEEDASEDAFPSGEDASGEVLFPEGDLPEDGLYLDENAGEEDLLLTEEDAAGEEDLSASEEETEETVLSPEDPEEALAVGDDGGLYAGGDEETDAFSVAEDVLTGEEEDSAEPVGAVSVTGVSVIYEEHPLISGDTAEVEAVIEPSDASNRNVSWTSSDESVILIEMTEGLYAGIRAEGPGTAVVTVTTEDGGFTASCEITVDENPGGSCGENLTWKLLPDGDENLRLVIEGSGAMEDYASYADTPWEPYRTRLSGVVLPDALTHIGNQAFYGISGLSEISLPAGLESIGDGAFRQCGYLTLTDLPSGLEEIGADAFRSCSSLDGIVLPGSLRSIGSGAFRSCSRLSGIVIPGQVEEVGDEAFRGCASLSSALADGTDTRFGSAVFQGCGVLMIYCPYGSGAYEYAAAEGFDYTVTTPEVPNVESLTNKTGGISVKWSAAEGAAGYLLLRRTGSGEYEEAASIPADPDKASMEYTDAGAAGNAVSYTYKVAAYSEVLGRTYQSGWSGEAEGCYVQRPAISSVSNGANGTVVKWSAVDGATGYYVYRDGTKVKTVTSGATVSFTDTGASAGGTLYTYKLYAFRTVDGKTFKSPISAAKAVCRLDRPVIASVSNGAKGAVVKWSAVEGATGYYVYRDGTKVKTVTSGATVSFTDTGASAGGTKYSYKLYAIAAVDGTTYKSAVSAAAEILRLARPVISSVTNTAAASVVKWGKVTGAEGYYVYRDGTKVKTVTSGATVSFTDTGAKTNNTKYIYKIYAYASPDGAVVKSAVSAAVTSWYLTSPSVTSVTNSATASVVKWSKVTGAAGYYVYRNGTKVKTVTSGSTVTFTDTAAKTNGTKYNYKVSAYKTVSGTEYKSAVSGILTSYYVSRPAVSSLTSPAAGSVKAAWAKNAKASGYQLKLVTGTTTKTVTVNGADSVTKTVTALAKGSSCQVTLRTFKKVDGKNYWSAWSAAKTVTVKK